MGEEMLTRPVTGPPAGERPGKAPTGDGKVVMSVTILRRPLERHQTWLFANLSDRS